MKAILFESNTGFTRQYAELLSKKAGLPAMTLEAASSALQKNDEVFFMGWLMAGGLKGYKKAARRYALKGVAAVGMAAPADKFAAELTEKYHIQDTKVFYLQGGFDMAKLHGIYKFLMKSMSRVIRSSIEKKQEKTPEDLMYLEMIGRGKSFVREENLAPILQWMGR